MKHTSVWLLVCVVLALLRSSQAWWATGHMIVAQIGYDYLNDSESEETRAALQNAFDALQTYYADSSTFVTSACWMDDLKDRKLKQFDPWHYINIPFCTGNITAPCQGVSFNALVKQPSNIVWAINTAFNTISSSQAGGFERGWALKTLIHLVGDIHQPLHCIEGYSDENPTGDLGGNLFDIIPTLGVDNLHSLWDSGAGLFNNNIKRPLSVDNQAYIESWARNISAKINVSEITNLHNVSGWAEDSALLSTTYAYDLPFNSTPSADYIATAQVIIERQIGIAGYRLAQLLKQIVLCSNKTNNCPNLFPPAPTCPTPKDDHPVGYTVTAAVLGSALLVSLIGNAVFIYLNSRRKWKGYKDLDVASNRR